MFNCTLSLTNKIERSFQLTTKTCYISLNLFPSQVSHCLSQSATTFCGLKGSLYTKHKWKKIIIAITWKLTRDNDGCSRINDTTVWPYTVPAWRSRLHFETYFFVRRVLQFEVGGDYICERTCWKGKQKCVIILFLHLGVHFSPVGIPPQHHCKWK